jgi:hypothetical protein
MKQYEITLSKIAPTFYKLIQYFDFAFKNSQLINRYLIKAGLTEIAQVNALELLKLLKNCSYKYHYYIFFYELTKHGYLAKIALTTENNLDIYGFSSYSVYSATFDEVIVNMVINKFSFENKHIMAYEFGVPKNFILSHTYKDLFIALVGKDTYETIRRNIK